MVLAFDLGGTRTKHGVVDAETGEVFAAGAAPTPPTAAEAVEQMVDTARSLVSRGDGVDGLGLSMPGLITADGVCRALPGKLPGAEGLNLGALVGAELGIPSLVVNDAIAHGAGEAAYGAGRGHARVVVMTLGTGVGVAAFERGLPLGTGELGGGILGGQIPISAAEAGPLDTNGRPDTIEAHCRAQRIPEMVREAGGACESVEDAYKLWGEGDPAARQAIGGYRAALTRALVALAHAHAPDVLVVGGGPVCPGNPVLPGLEAEVNRRLFRGYLVLVREEELGERAALVGVAGLQRERAR